MAWTPTSFGGVDGDFTAAVQEGVPRPFVPIKEQPAAFGVRITLWQYRANWAPLPALSTYTIDGQTGYLVDETQPEDMGGGVVRWERVYVRKPASWSTNVIVNKTYQWAQYIYSGTTDPRPIVDQSIVSWTKQVTGTCSFDYYLGSYGLPYLPSAPFIQTIKFFGSQIITDLGSGFPLTTQFGNIVFNNNIAYSFVSASIEQYMGNIYVLKKIYA